MFMQRIEVPEAVGTRPKRTAVKLAVGLLFVLVAAVLMVPWTIALALWIGLVAVAKAAAKAAAFVRDSLLYAGELVLGR